MGKQVEGSLQERIQKIIVKRGGYCFKNHGDMTTEPGRPDIVCCYKGLFIAIEAKVDYNKPSKQQGIHCRKIWSSYGIACVVCNTVDIDKLLDLIDNNYNIICNLSTHINEDLRKLLIDDGTRW